MSTFPLRSTGVLLSAMADRAIAYDLLTETAHQLNASAGTLLAACDGEGDVDEAVAAWADGASVDREVVAADVTAGLAMLEELSLIGRDEPVESPKEVVGSTADPASRSLP
ncbi:MAG: PqqD family protein [Microthrixaceae bacterium]